MKRFLLTLLACVTAVAVLTAQHVPTNSSLPDTLPASMGGTGTTTPTADGVLIGNGTIWNIKVLPSCSNATTSKLLYDSSTDTWSCGTDQDTSGAPTNAQYWTGAADGTLSAEKNLGALSTGLVINTSGVPSAYTGTTCSAGQFANALSASGAATCATPSGAGDVLGPGSSTNTAVPLWNGTSGTALSDSKFTFTGPATSLKTFTLPNASATILTDNAAVTVAQGGSGATTLTGILKGNGTSAFTAATAGTDYLTSGTLVSMSVLTSGTGATYTVPSNVTRLLVKVQGGGGGGGGGDQGTTTWGCGSGGGAGGYAEKIISTSAGSTFTYTIGGSANGGTAGNNSGTAGNATTWDSGGSPVVGNGGDPGGSMAAGNTLVGASAGVGGTATGGTLNITGGDGNIGLRYATSNVMVFGGGGVSPLGAGSTRISSGVGANGTGYGSGGGGGVAFINSADVAGGNGAQGVILVYEYK